MIPELTPTARHGYLDSLFRAVRIFGYNIIERFADLTDIPFRASPDWLKQTNTVKGGADTLSSYLSANPDRSLRDIFPVVASARNITDNTSLLLSIPGGTPAFTGNLAVAKYIAKNLPKPKEADWWHDVDLKRITERATAVYTIASLASYDNMADSSTRAKKMEFTREELAYIHHALGLGTMFKKWKSKQNQANIREWGESVEDNDDLNHGMFMDDEYDNTAEADEFWTPDEAFIETEELLENQSFYRTPGGERRYQCLRVSNLLLLHDDAIGELLILTTEDIGDIRRIFEQTALTCMYLRCYCDEVLPDDVYKGHVIVDTLKSARKALVKAVCATYRRASINWSSCKLIGSMFGLVADVNDARCAGSRWTDNVKRVDNKVVEKIGEFVPEMKIYMSHFELLPIKESHELSEIKKLSLLPMVCPVGHFYDQELLYATSNTSGGPDGSEAERIYQDTLLMARWQRINLVKRISCSPIYLGTVRKSATPKDWHQRYQSDGIPIEFFRDSRDLDMTGTESVYSSSEACLMMSEDRGMTPDGLDKINTVDEYRRLDKVNSKFLLWALRGAEEWSFDKALSDNRKCTHNVKTGDRLEYKKDDGRMFFQAVLSTKFLFMCLERHTQIRLNLKPGSLMSAAPRKKIENRNSLMNAISGNADVDVDSSDQEKFSPRLDKRYHADMDDEDAEFFGDKRMIGMSDRMTSSLLISDTYGQFLQFRNPHADHEGMLGKRNTDRHETIGKIIDEECDNRTQTEKLTDRQVFVDDAVQARKIRGKSEVTRKANAKQYQAVREEVYLANCLSPSKDKNYDSDRFAVITGDKSYDGEPIRQGLKAFFGFASFNPVPVETFGTRNNACFATGQGSASSGGLLECATWTYTWYTLLYAELMAPKSITRMPIMDCGLMSVTPMRLGGLGMVGSLQIDSNAAGPTTATGLSILKELSIVCPTTKPYINNILNQELEEVSDEDWMRDPGQYMVKGHRIRTMRNKSACIKAATEQASNPTLLKLIEDSRRIDMAAIGAELRKNPKIDRDRVKSFWNSSSRAKAESIMGKFQNADSIISLLGRRKIGRLRLAARRDIYGVCSQWNSRMTGKNYHGYIRLNPSDSIYDDYE